MNVLSGLINWIISLNLSMSLTLFLILFSLLLVFVVYNHKKIYKKIKNAFKKTKLSCEECIHMLLNIKTKYETGVMLVKDNILRNQMNYYDQKEQQLIFELVDSYNNDQKELDDFIRKNKEITLYEEALKNSLYKVREEIERSFRENGFHKLEPIDFNRYVNDKSKSLLSIARNYLRHHYPHTGMYIKLSQRFENFDRNRLHDIVYDVFINASKIRADAENKLNELEQKFIDDLDKHKKKVINNDDDRS